MSEEANRPEWLPRVNLCAVTRDAHLVRTVISVRIRGRYYPWLEFGSLTDTGDSPATFIGARYEGVTDTEHDSAYAFRVEVTDVQFVGVYHGVVTLRARIAGSAEDSEALCVPSQSILSFDELGAEHCEECAEDPEQEDHFMIDRFSPEADVALWKRLRGCEIRIETSPNVPEEPE